VVDVPAGATGVPEASVVNDARATEGWLLSCATYVELFWNVAVDTP
jgi:hypothetical protein